MKQYRIVSNGLNFRIQWLGRTFLLRRPKWKWFRSYTYAGDYIVEFNTKPEAQKQIERCQKEDKAKQQGYTCI